MLLGPTLAKTRGRKTAERSNTNEFLKWSKIQRSKRLERRDYWLERELSYPTLRHALRVKGNTPVGYYTVLGLKSVRTVLYTDTC
jgi:hypothetical protein